MKNECRREGSVWVKINGLYGVWVKADIIK